MSDRLSFQFNAQNKDQILFGQASGSTIEISSVAGVANILRSDHPASKEAKHKRLQQFLEIVDATRVYIEQLQQDIDELEAGFRARDGDAWRETLALKILDPDEVPQRREGENIEDYRERLEPILTDQMLDTDGSIKAQYLNNPELSDYAQWAQKKHHYNLAVGYVRELEAPSTTPQRIEDIESELKQITDAETLVFAELNAAAHSDVQGKIKGIADEAHDDLGINEQKVDDSFFQLKT